MTTETVTNKSGALTENPITADEAVEAVEKNVIPKEEKSENPPEAEKPSGGSIDRDIVLAKVESEKRISLIKAWEESEKAKVQNKSEKKLSGLVSRENSKKASIEVKLKKKEEEMEKKKAMYAEKMKNEIARVHKEAEEERAEIECKRAQDILKVEEKAAKFRATGIVPKKILGFFGG